MAKQFNAHLGDELNRDFEQLAQRTGHNKSSLLEALIRDGKAQLEALDRAGRSDAPLKARLTLTTKQG